MRAVAFVWTHFWMQIDGMGRYVVDTITYTYNVFIMIYLSVRATFLDQAQGMRTIFSVVSMQIYFTAWQAMPLITVLALASGSVVILQSTQQLSLLGGTNMIGTLLMAIIVRELGPLITALIVIARSGTAVASELGNMKVNREIEALHSMGINHLSFIVFPRILGGIISVLCMAFYFNLIALGGGYLVSRILQDMPFSFYTELLANAIEQEDVWVFLLKNSFSGALIFVICCYQGMLVQRSPHEVPQVTTKAVVNSVIYVVTFNMVVTILFYLSQLAKLGVI